MNTLTPSPLDHRVLWLRRRDAGDRLQIPRRAPFGRGSGWLSVAMFELCIAGTVVVRAPSRLQRVGPYAVPK
jgi:hypothetical protein